MDGTTKIGGDHGSGQQVSLKSSQMRRPNEIQSREGADTFTRFCMQISLRVSARLNIEQVSTTVGVELFLSFTITQSITESLSCNDNIKIIITN